MGLQLAVSQSAVVEVTVLWTDWKSLIATEVDLQMEEKVASCIVTSSKDTSINSLEVVISAIELGIQKTLTNLVDLALLKATENGLLTSVLVAGLWNRIERHQLVDAMFRPEIKIKTFTTPMAYFNQTTLEDQGANA